MQLSRFVLTYENVGPGEHVLYNVLADRYIGIDDATLAALTAWCLGELPSDPALNPDDRAAAALLEESGFLVSGRDADDRLLAEHLRKRSEGVPGVTHITLQPTLACDLACTYCFQKEFPAFHRMSSGVESATVEWILRRVEQARTPRLVVHYFGGEPLTRKDFVIRTAQIFSRAMKGRGGDFAWELTTNGLHLDLPFVKAMQECGEGAIKVTLDGDRDTHDQARIYRDGRGSFDRIYANLMEVAGHVKLRLGGNFLPGQAASYERLMDRIERTGLAPHLSIVKFKPVIDTSRESTGSCTGCDHAREQTDTLIQINRSVERRALGTSRIEPLEQMLGPCELHWRNNYSIDPDGYVYKCPAVAGRTEMAIGATWSAEEKSVAPLVEFRPWEQCGDCAFLPVCVGGCLGGEYLRSGRRDQVACRKQDFEASFRDAIPRRYLAELAGESWSVAPTA
jgi:uncharacterized protein